jgi:hypothetical protein
MRWTATANGRPDRKSIISTKISRKVKPEQVQTALAAAMRAAIVRKAVRR